MTLVSESGGPRHRGTDPITSQVAAELADLSGAHTLVVELLAEHGASAVFELQQRAYYSPSRISSSMTELERKGVVQLVPGVFRLTPYNRPAQVWQLA